VVNNAILMVDHSLQKLAEGMELIPAIWDGARQKFRAILMTSIAIIAGTYPQLGAIELTKASMGSVIIGGIFTSIIFTFLMVPIVFWYLERFRRFIIAKKV